ncbi:NUDIX hydrolase [Rothia sp. P7181]|uniref:NUDIX hydrolase n=1 Tax=Rothia sp. P7181 TaxID=3402663 RepID=UPI003AE6DD49
MNQQLRTVRTDYYHNHDAPAANSVKPAAAVAIVCNNRVLLVRRHDNGKWTLPGGTLEMTESMPQCAVREIKEETSIDVEIIDLLGTYTDPDIRIAYSDGEVRREFTIVYLATTTSTEVRIDSESSEYRWFTISALAEADVAQSQRKRLNDLIRYLETGEKRYA